MKALITGASSGIGRDMAHVLAEQGWELILVARRTNLLEELAESLPTACRVISADLGDPAACRRLYEQTKEDGVDMLVNNAGITRDAIFHKMTPQQWDAVMKVNLYSMYNCCRVVINGMRQHGYGRIVNLSSTAAYGNPGQAYYAATKAGVIGFTKTLARECQQGHYSQCDCPGFDDGNPGSKI